MAVEILRESKVIYMDNFAKSVLGHSSYYTLKALISIMCILTSIIGCEKARGVPPDTEKAEWGYETENGPDVWAQLSPEYILCAEGRHQSPIDLVNPTSAKLPPIIYEYHWTTSINIRNNGHTIEVAYPEGSWIEIDGTRYQLLQFHFHAPSEHTVAGKPFDMEMHLVHKSEDGSLAVVGLLIESGSHNASFNPVWAHLPAVPGETQRVEVDKRFPLDPRAMVSPDEEIEDVVPQYFPSYYRYEGSLTTPPCSEDVEWIVLTTAIEMSETQIAAFKAIIHDNNRPVQPLNGRELLLTSAADE